MGYNATPSRRTLPKGRNYRRKENKAEYGVAFGVKRMKISDKSD